ncbi:MAG TPA: quinone-dependent dihydroorotate dehydrogenase [Ktedonobacterales bacterium]
MLYRRVLRPALFRASSGDPEAIHERVLALLARVSRSPAATAALARAAALAVPGSQAAPREVFGLRFPNPVGLAAGFDKNAIAVPALAALGFGFVEIGTITAQPQPGNPRPRLFRLAEDAALINRMGFNNAGAAAVAARLAQLPRLPVPLGISLGKSKVTPLDEAVGDYLDSLDRLYLYGDYFAVNISSPNTPGLRALHERDRLDVLLAALTARLRERTVAEGRSAPRPLLVKVAPDLDDAALEEVVDVALARGVSGLIAVNTTVAREGMGLRAPEYLLNETGGLSGRPLFARALAVVTRLHALAGGRLPIVGCGGIFTPDDARRMLDAGASLVQLYTGFIYEGPMVARRIARALG